MSSERIALITGANKGIGFAIARQLGEKGFSVCLGCRDQARGENAVQELRRSDIDAHLVILDVTDDESVRSAAATVSGMTDKLDVLVNNAGILIDEMTPVSEQSTKDISSMFEVNSVGPIRVTQAFLPLLRKSPSPRVVMMSSGLGSLSGAKELGSKTWFVKAGGYSASKSALNMLTIKLAKELLHEGIKVNAADPGFTATDLNGHTGPRSVGDAARIAVELATLADRGPTGGFFHDGYFGNSPSHYPW